MPWSALKRTPVQDFNSFSIMFYYIISTTYKKIGNLFCSVHISGLSHSVQIVQGGWSMGMLNKEGIIRIKGKILSHSWQSSNGTIFSLTQKSSSYSNALRNFEIWKKLENIQLHWEYVSMKFVYQIVKGCWLICILFKITFVSLVIMSIAIKCFLKLESIIGWLIIGTVSHRELKF